MAGDSDPGTSSRSSTEDGSSPGPLGGASNGTADDDDSTQPLLAPPAGAREDEASAERGPVELKPGTCVGRYVLLNPLGAGGMGVVYSGYDPELDRAVAVKLLRLGSGGEEASVARERLLREAQALARLSHPNVVGVYDAGSYGEHVFIALELVKGKTLRELLRTPPPVKAMLQMLIAAGRGLAAAHEAGLMHRDFKPANVIVGDDGRVRVLDFGLARLAEGAAALGVEDPTADQVPPGDEAAGDREDGGSPSQSGGPPRRRGDISEGYGSGAQRLAAPLTQHGAVMGTPAYMAPEQYEDGTAGALSDQFSFCVTAWEALYGQAPFARRTGPRRWEVRAVDTSRVPHWVRAVLQRGLAEAPHERWPSMAHLLEALSADPTPRRRRRLAVGGLVLTAAAALSAYSGHRARVRAGCEREGAAVADVWNEGRAQRIAAAFAKAAPPYAVDTWQRARPAVDAYARGWRTSRATACVQGELTRARTPDQLARSRTCLDEALAVLAKMSTAWEAPATASIRAAHRAVTALPPVEACLDERELARAPPTVVAGAAHERVRALRVGLAEASALAALGRAPEAAGLARTLVEKAEAAGSPALQALALLRLGVSQRAAGETVSARETLKKALFQSEAAADDALAARALNGLASAELALLNLEGAERALWLADIKVKRLRLGAHPIAVETSLNQARLAALEGQHAQSRRAAEEALRLSEEVFGAESAHASLAAGEVAATLLRQGLAAAGLAAYARALRLSERLFGAEHPETAGLKSRFAAALHEAGRDEEALMALTDALRTQEKMLGVDDPEVAASLRSLGDVLYELGRFDEARAHHERSLAISARASAEAHLEVALGLGRLGMVQLALERYRDAADSFQRALNEGEKVLGAGHLELVGWTQALGEALEGLGQAKEALDVHERALKAAEKLRGAPPSLVARVLVGRARVQLALGLPDAAVATLDRAQPALDKVPAPTLAEAEFLRAQVLWRSSASRPAARALAQSAHGRLRSLATPRARALSAELEEWLTSRRVSTGG